MTFVLNSNVNIPCNIFRANVALCVGPLYLVFEETNLGPAENGMYVYGDLPFLFSTVNRNGSNTCEEKVQKYVVLASPV